MSSWTVREAFRARLADNWVDATLPVLEVANRSQARGARPAEFVTMEFLAEEETHIAIPASADGSGYREHGVVRVSVHVRPNGGDERAVKACDLVRGIFRKAKLAGGAVVVESVSPPMDDAGDDRGSHYVVACEIAYRHDL